jgi:hypothetical protein
VWNVSATRGGDAVEPRSTNLAGLPTAVVVVWTAVDTVAGVVAALLEDPVVDGTDRVAGDLARELDDEHAAASTATVPVIAVVRKRRRSIKSAQAPTPGMRTV